MFGPRKRLRVDKAHPMGKKKKKGRKEEEKKKKREKKEERRKGKEPDLQGD